MNKVSLSDIATIYNGNSINQKVKQEKYTGHINGFNYIGTKDIDFDGTVNYENGVKIPFEDNKFKTAPAGSVFVCAEGGSAGRKSAYINQEVCFGNKLYAIVNSKMLFDPLYLYYFTRSKLFFSQFKNLLNGIIGGVSTKNFGTIKIPLPPLADQHRIVTKIEELFSQLDSGVETLKKTKKQLAVYRQAVLKEAFEDCPSIKVEDVCVHVTDGDHLPPPKALTGIPFIMISNIENNKINWSNTAFVGLDYYKSLNEKRRPQKGDVLYTVTGSFGIPVLVDFEKEFCFQRHIALLRPNERITQKYLYYAMQTPNVYIQARDKSTGTAQKTVGLAVLRKIVIPFVKSIQQQNDTVHNIEAKLSVCDSIEKTVDDALQQAEALRQSILKKEFEGGLT